MKPVNSPLLSNARTLMEKLDSGTMNPAEVIAAYEWALANESVICAEIGKMKIAEIKELITVSHAKTKVELVSAFYGYIREHFVLGSICYTMDMMSSRDAEAARLKRIEAERRIVNATTEEQIAKHAKAVEERNAARRERREKIMNAIKNPQTLEDFEIIKNHRKDGLEGLSASEKATCDRLIWERNRARRKMEENQASRIEAVDLVDVEVTLHKTQHTQKGHDLYVVVLSDWIEKNDFESLCDIAHQLSGYYSDYSAPGAIPGFTFRDEANARQFIEVFSNDISTAEQRAERKRMALMNTRDRLNALAESMIREADEDLARPRKCNTVRRANQLESTIRRNLAWKALAKTLASVANTFGDGEHPLDGIRHRIHVETLGLYIKRLQWAKPKCEDRDELIKDATLPKVYLTRSDAIEAYRKLKPLKNTIRLCDHLLKRIRETPEDGKITFNDRISRDYAVKCFQKLGDDCAWYLADALRETRRLDRMGIRSSSELRHALRAYWSHAVAPEEIPVKDRMVRDLIGRDLPGFFPTPGDLVDHLLELAEIPTGATVIEPSAGIGSIADAIAERHPDATLTCVEFNSRLVEILKMEHGQVIHGDWLEQTATADRIVMNPPFEEGMDMVHVRHAYDRLNTGGRLVAIMSSGSVQNTTGKAVAFQEWLREVGARVISNPEGSFLSSFRSTGVNTITVIINRQAVATVESAVEAA